METVKHSRAKFIWNHQLVVLLFACLAYQTTKDGGGIIFSIAVGLAPLVLIIVLPFKRADPVYIRRNWTFLISSLLGGVLSFALVACWIMFAVAAMVGGFQN